MNLENEAENMTEFIKVGTGMNVRRDTHKEVSANY